MDVVTDSSPTPVAVRDNSNQTVTAAITELRNSFSGLASNTQELALVLAPILPSTTQSLEQAPLGESRALPENASCPMAFELQSLYAGMDVLNNIVEELLTNLKL